MARNTGFSRWIDTFVSEKGFGTCSNFDVETSQDLHIVELATLIDYLKTQVCQADQEKIKITFIKIDFKNGDAMHFFNHLAHGMIYAHYGE